MMKRPNDMNEDELRAEVVRLRDLLQHNSAEENSHMCKKCLFGYTPIEGESEDCPRCGHDGQ